MKLLKIIISCVFVYYSGFSLPVEIKNSTEILKKNEVSIQNTIKYNFVNDTLQTTGSTIDSTDIDRKGKTLSYIVYFPYGGIRFNQKFHYNEFDSLDIITFMDSEDQPKSLIGYGYIFENNRLIEKKNREMDFTVSERSLYYYDVNNKISNIIVYDEVSVIKNYLTFTYQDGQLIKTEILDRAKKPLLTEQFEYNELGKCSKFLQSDLTSNTSKIKEYSYDSFGRFTKIVEFLAGSENREIYLINYEDNGLLRDVILTNNENKQLFKIEYIYSFYKKRQKN